jgi:hypothetical protein
VIDGPERVLSEEHAALIARMRVDRRDRVIERAAIIHEADLCTRDEANARAIAEEK